MKYPRVLVVVMGRINAADNFNNGLLLRNLFARWPKENLAQIYSGGDNGDAGYFGHYYKLGPQDRRLGWLFYKLKSEALKESAEEMSTLTGRASVSKVATLRAFGKRMLMDTGLYELVFRPRLSKAMLEWVEHFHPEFIFTQGYNLAFTWLPLMLAQRFKLPIIYYPTDDWPSDLYKPGPGLFGGIATLTHHLVKRASHQLVSSAAICIAFNEMMREEYQERYGKAFTVLMHGDDWRRFESAVPQRLVQSGEYWIVSTGVFDRHRFPLLFDLDEACEILAAKGIRARATIFSVNQIKKSDVERLRWVQIGPCPSHTDLISFLRGADILFLPERFDGTVRDIKLCVSSKAHLFMFSARPIVVYSDPLTGIVHYARQGEWAAVVDRRGPSWLAETFIQLLNDRALQERLISNANKIAMQNHDLAAIQSRFFGLVTSFHSNFSS